jgi:peptide/nickel transport system substrate-binding protein
MRALGGFLTVMRAALLGTAILLVAAWAHADGHRGGTLRLLASAGAGTLDPHLNYTVLYAQTEQSLFDGLTAFRKAAGTAAYTVVPDLAEALPIPADGGRTYVFRLRPNIRFSNGKVVGVQDVLASMRRMFKVSGPNTGTWYRGIVGAEACLKSAATCTLAGGVVADAAAGTVTFHLVAADPEFLQKLAEPQASILPEDAPAHDIGVVPVPGTGPYMVVSYDPKKQLRLLRNPHFHQWSADAQPDGYADEVDFDFGLSDEDQLTAVENGQADWLYDPVPVDRLNEIGTRYAAQVHVNPMGALYHLEMNMHVPPFDKLAARQAVNFALDRGALVKIFGGPKLAVPSCQILPPGIPGYRSYCPYTRNPGTVWSAPDVARARELVQSSGTAGQKVTLIVEDTAVGRAIGTYVQSVLNDIGYVAAVKALATSVEFSYIQNSNNKVQIGYNFWFQDYPAASDFLEILFSCASFHPGSDVSINYPGMCEPAIDADMKRARLLAGSDPAAAERLWADIDRRVTDLAPYAVMFNPRRLDFVSRRVGNVIVSGQFQLLYAQLWVK